VSKLDAEAVMSISSEMLISIIDSIPPTQRSLVSDATGARIPVVPSLEDVTPEMCHYSRACIALQERVVIVWSQDPKAIINVTNHVQREILDMVSAGACPITGPETNLTQAQTTLEEDPINGRTPSSFTQRSSSTTPVSTPAIVRGGLDEKNEVFQRAVALEENEDDNEDVEGTPVRPKLKMHAFKISLAIMLVIITQSLGITKVRRLSSHTRNVMLTSNSC
jgi:hypothetical protein